MTTNTVEQPEEMSEADIAITSSGTNMLFLLGGSIGLFLIGKYLVALAAPYFI